MLILMIREKGRKKWKNVAAKKCCAALLENLCVAQVRFQAPGLLRAPQLKVTIRSSKG